MINNNTIYTTRSSHAISTVTGADFVVSGTSVSDVINELVQVGLYVPPDPNLEHEFPELKHARIAVNNAIIDALGEEVKSRLAAHRELRQRCKQMQDIEKELRG